MVYKLIIFSKVIEFDNFEDLQIYLYILEKYCKEHSFKIIPFEIKSDSPFHVNFD